MAVLNDLSGLKIEPKTADIDAPELGEGAVLRIRELTAWDRVLINDAIEKAAGNREEILNAQILARSLVTEDGRQLIGSPDEGIRVLRALPIPLTLRFFDAVTALNGIDDGKKNV